MATYEEYFTGNFETADGWHNRSEKDMVFAMFLARKGLEPGEIACVLKNAEYNKDKILKEKYLQRTIGKAMEIVQERSVIAAQLGTDANMRSNLPPRAESSSAAPAFSPKLYTYSELKDVEFPEPELISTGIKCLDAYLNGGLALKEVSLFIAAQETGKSTIASFIGAQAVRQGYNTLHLFYEDELSSVKGRYDSHLRDGIWSSEAYLLDATEYPASLKDVEFQIQQIKPAMVIIDYFARIPPLKGKGEGRFEIKDTLMYLCNLARKYNTHILVTDHITVEDEGKHSVPNYRMAFHRVSEAKMYKTMIVGVIVGLMRDQVDNNKLWATGMKMKRKAKKMFTTLTVDWDTGKFV